eukprot:TRINITY_DN23385_c0_g1_i1.p1 TRINITY_DN23385_c0_g1~~TRINITY_DN23385_c0_g1_i1.p1  ORF type:complete len:238 (+),score=36.06 TRINITY_DN23385_c0_g1_i1:66-779(+)
MSSDRSSIHTKQWGEGINELSVENQEQFQFENQTQVNTSQWDEKYKNFTVNPEKRGRGRPKKDARKPLNIISLDDLEKLGKDRNPVKETRGRPKGCTQKQIMYNNYAMGHLPNMIEPLTELEQLDTLYDFNLDKTETNSDMNMASTACQACCTFNSSPCGCGKYLYCDILCQMNDDHHCPGKSPLISQVILSKDGLLWPCDICERSFQSLPGLKRHITRTHTKCRDEISTATWQPGC